MPSPGSCWRSSAILIVPLPAVAARLLLGINIFGSALVLLLAVTVEDPLEFSAFAPALLVATLFRLVARRLGDALDSYGRRDTRERSARSFRRSAPSSSTATWSSG